VYFRPEILGPYENVPMVAIDKLPIGMQQHVIGVPKPWLQLFQRLENIVVCYDRVQQPQA
jgi:hypothetical protein